MSLKFNPTYHMAWFVIYIPMVIGMVIIMDDLTGWRWWLMLLVTTITIISIIGKLYMIDKIWKRRCYGCDRKLDEDDYGR